MRMFHYQVAVTFIVAPLLLAAACLGIFGYAELHLRVALVAAIAAIGAHSLFILFMIVTGRILREAIKNRELEGGFLDELNEFFATKKAYPAGILAAFFVVVAGVLGYSSNLGVPPWIHWIAGIGALAYNLWAFPVELRTLRANQYLVDRAAAALDALDRASLERGEELPADEPLSPRALQRGAAIVTISAWFPYFYWGIVAWRGDFTKVSIHPWVEVSAFAAFVWLLARKEARDSAGAPLSRS